VVVFVGVAAFTTTSGPNGTGEVVTVLVLLAVVLAGEGLLFVLLHRRRSSLLAALGAATLFGFVATLAKVILDRLRAVLGTGQGFTAGDWFTLLCFVALLVSGAFGLYLVQRAYAAGSADLVVAALTVIDPLIAVTVGITVLHEAAGAPIWAMVVFAAAGALAVGGVLLLARHPPEVPAG
jgi:drug/metabolite transporter (DMT)-like permease